MLSNFACCLVTEFYCAVQCNLIFHITGQLSCQALKSMGDINFLKAFTAVFVNFSKTQNHLTVCSQHIASCNYRNFRLLFISVVHHFWSMACSFWWFRNMFIKWKYQRFEFVTFIIIILLIQTYEVLRVTNKII